MIKDDETKFELWVGFFEGLNFTWKKISTHDTFGKGYAAFKDFSKNIINMSDDDIIEKYNSGRVDVELKYGEKNINWFGVNISITSEEEL